MRQTVDTYSGQSEEGYGKDTKTGRHNFPHPRLGHRIAVANCGDRYDAPPERVCITGEIIALLTVLIDRVLFRQVDEIGAEY